MGKLIFKQGERKIVNGIERAYHGSFGNGGLHDFVRYTNNSGEIEYCLFSDLEANKDGTLNGKVKKSFFAHPAPVGSIVFASGSDLYMRGKEILENKGVAA